MHAYIVNTYTTDMDGQWLLGLVGRASSNEGHWVDVQHVMAFSHVYTDPNLLLKSRFLQL